MGIARALPINRSLLIPLIAALVVGVFLPVAPLPAQQDPAPPSQPVSVLLQPGDMVRLKIWREPDLSGDYQVDENGEAVFPKIGVLAVGEISTDSLKAVLVATYSAFLRNPSIDVTLLRRVNVLGAVRSPGLYHVDPTVTVADVLAMAGGVNSDGNPDRIELLRGGKKLSSKLSQESRLTESPLRSGDQLRVPQKSWASRNTALIAAGITGAAFIIAASVNY